MTADLVAFLHEQLDVEERGVYTRRARVHAMTCDGFPSEATESGRSEERVHEIDNCTCGGPARVLAEITAKRQLADRYEQAMENRRAHPDDLASAGALLALHGAAKLLALPYADRPDYRPEWAPDF